MESHSNEIDRYNAIATSKFVPFSLRFLAAFTFSRRRIPPMQLAQGEEFTRIERGSRSAALLRFHDFTCSRCYVDTIN